MSETLRLVKRLWAFIRRKPLDDDLEDELAAHLQFAIDDNIARGMSRTEARRMALISIGGMDQARYQHREARGFMTLDISNRTSSTRCGRYGTIPASPLSRS